MISQLDEIMFDIIPRMKNFSDNPVCLFEENFGISKDGYLFNRADNHPTEMLAKSYYGYLETIRKMGVDVITTRGLNETIWYLISMHGYLGKEHYPKHNKYFSDKEIAIGMLTAIPGIGDARASKALGGTSIRGMMGLKHITGLTQKQSERLNRIAGWRG
jgi:ERCC4-type nuclease